jgi:hypothetical protein
MTSPDMTSPDMAGRGSCGARRTGMLDQKNRVAGKFLDAGNAA